MDAGKDNDLPDDVTGKRLPDWLIDLEGANRSPDDPESTRRRKLRPDILIIEGLTASDIAGLNPDEIREHVRNNTQRLIVHVLEVGYCSDINHAHKDNDKRTQHEGLVTLLRGSNLQVQFHDPVTLGRCGSLQASLTNLLKDTFYLTAPQAQTVAFSLTRHAVQWVDKMYTHRQHILAAAPTPRHPG